MKGTDWREICTEKEKKKKEEEEVELRSIRSETEAWKYINKYRNKRTTIENNITEQQWKEYFRNSQRSGTQNIR